MAKNKKSDREKTKLEIAKIISEDENFVRKIQEYRSIVNKTILNGCGGYNAWSDVCKNHTFISIGTEKDIESWCEEHNIQMSWFGAHTIADIVINDIMSIRLLEYIDEEVYIIYSKEQHENMQGQRLVINLILQNHLDNIITKYITSHIFWASPCRTLLMTTKYHWVNNWCKITPENKDTSIAGSINEIIQGSEDEADDNLTEAALIAESNTRNKDTIQKALDKLFTACNIYYNNGLLRKRAMAYVLAAELYGKIGRTDLVKHYTDQAMYHLDQKLDKELIKHCKTLLESMPKKATHIAMIYRVLPSYIDGVLATGYLGSTEISEFLASYIEEHWGGGSYEIRYMNVDIHGHATQTDQRGLYIQGPPKKLDTVKITQPQLSAGNSLPQVTTDTKFNKPHILVTKPPITVNMNATNEAYQNLKTKKRSEARKQNRKKIQEPGETEFVKAAVSGKLFRDEPDDSDT